MRPWAQAAGMWLTTVIAVAGSAPRQARAEEPEKENDYAEKGATELGGSIDGSWRAEQFNLRLSPFAGYFIRDRVELTAIGALDYENVRADDGTRDGTLAASLALEPSYHLPLSSSTFLFGGLGLGIAEEDDKSAFELVPRLGLNIEVGRSGVFSPAVRLHVPLGAGSGKTGPHEEIAWEAGFSTSF